jgi:flagellin
MEYQQLVQEADRISKTTNFNGRSLLQGDGSVLQFQVGAQGNADNQIELDSGVTDASAEGLGIGGTSILDKEAALDNLQVIDDAIARVSGFRATFGSVQSRLQTSINTIDVAVVNQEEARSRIEDVDVAYSAAKAASAQIKNAAGTATLVQANQMGANALRLIG